VIENYIVGPSVPLFPEARAPAPLTNRAAPGATRNAIKGETVTPAEAAKMLLGLAERIMEHRKIQWEQAWKEAMQQEPVWTAIARQKPGSLHPRPPTPLHKSESPRGEFRNRVASLCAGGLGYMTAWETARREDRPLFNRAFGRTN